MQSPDKPTDSTDLPAATSGKRPDLRAVLQEEIASEDQAPVVCVTDLRAVFPDLFLRLDLGREALARLPYRLLFWVTEHEQEQLARNAPNFYSRLSGTFLFLLPVATPEPNFKTPARPLRLAPPSNRQRRRPLIPVKDEKQRAGLIARQQRRIQELAAMERPDTRAIADSWYDLAGLYGGGLAPAWHEAKEAYLQAAASYARANHDLAQAEALARAGNEGNSRGARR